MTHTHAAETRCPERLRAARTCYDHLAGRLGVAITDALTAAGDLERDGGDFRLTAAGRRRLTALGVDVAAAQARPRPLARARLHWSERRPHLAGALGAALARRLLDLGWIARRPGDRRLEVTARGAAGLERAFGLRADPYAISTSVRPKSSPLNRSAAPLDLAQA